MLQVRYHYCIIWWHSCVSVAAVTPSIVNKTLHILFIGRESQCKQTHNSHHTFVQVTAWQQASQSLNTTHSYLSCVTICCNLLLTLWSISISKVHRILDVKYDGCLDYGYGHSLDFTTFTWLVHKNPIWLASTCINLDHCMDDSLCVLCIPIL